MSNESMIRVFFVTDLHGMISRYEKLFAAIEEEKPLVLFLGGDLLSHRLRPVPWDHTLITNFVTQYLQIRLAALREMLKDAFPAIFVIMGNDDARSEETYFIDTGEKGLWSYIHNRSVEYRGYTVYGYAYVPPTPFQIKDWEKYDVSRYVDPGCIPPTEGFRTVETGEDIEHATISIDLKKLVRPGSLDRSIFLFHSPPYQTSLDRAALDGITLEGVPLDVNVGSIAIKRFIEEYQPYITLHGHIHESSRITGQWMEMMGKTVALNAAVEPPDLAIIKFDLDDPLSAQRIIL
jgi:Icc-related predicted phosphoesterase